MARKEIEKRRRLGNEASAMVFGREVGQLASRLANAGARVIAEASADAPSAQAGRRTWSVLAVRTRRPLSW